MDTQEKKIAHEKLAEETEDIFQEPSKLGVKLSPEFLESCYTPIIQSGGKFDLKPSAFSNSDNLYYGACTQPPSAPSEPKGITGAALPQGRNRGCSSTRE